MLSLCQRVSPSSDIGNYCPISITPLLSMVYEKIVTRKLDYFLESNRLLPPSQFSCRRGLETCDALLTLSRRLQVALDMGMESRLVQLNFSAAFDRESYCRLLYKLRCIGEERQFLLILLEFLSDRVHLDDKVSSSIDTIDEVSGVLQGSV